MYNIYMSFARDKCKAVYGNNRMYYETATGCKGAGLASVRENFLNEFVGVYNFVPPLNKPDGRFVVDRNVQEDFGEFPIRNFESWQAHVPDTNAELAQQYGDSWSVGNTVAGFDGTQLEAYVGNRNQLYPKVEDDYSSRFESNTPWFVTDGCCQCEAQTNPEFFDALQSNHAVDLGESGYLDNMHSIVQVS